MDRVSFLQLHDLLRELSRGVEPKAEFVFVVHRSTVRLGMQSPASPPFCNAWSVQFSPPRPLFFCSQFNAELKELRLNDNQVRSLPASLKLNRK